MALLFEQVPVGTTPTALPLIPAGPCTFSLTVIGTTGTVFLGGPTVGTTGSYQLAPGVQYTFPQLPGSSSTQFYGVATAATTLNFAISTNR